MSLFNPFAFDVLGRPAGPVAPPALRVIGEQATPTQMAQAQSVFVGFLSAARLSQVPNPSQLGKLPDGTAYRIVSVAGQCIMQIWPEGKVVKRVVDSGIVFAPNDLSRNWLLINEPTESGKSSNLWRFRDISDDYDMDLSITPRAALLIAGGWKYSYRANSLGRYGHANAYVLRAGTLSHVTPGGTILAVSVNQNSTTFTQHLANRKIGQLAAPAYGHRAGSDIESQWLEASASAVVIDPELRRIIALDLNGAPLYASSPNGRYLAIQTEIYTDQQRTRQGPLVFAPDYYEIEASNWPTLRYAVASDRVILVTDRVGFVTAPALYYENAVQAKVFVATDAGYVPDKQPLMGQLEFSCTPTIARVIGGNVQGTQDFGVRITNQVWPHPHLITGVSVIETSPTGTVVELSAIRSGECGYQSNKDYRTKDRFLEGVDAEGNPLTFDEEFILSYSHKYTRPTDVNIVTRTTVTGQMPVAGRDLIVGEESSNLVSGTFRSEIESIRRTIRKYSDGLELVLRDSVVQVEHAGDFYRDLLHPSKQNPTLRYSSTTTYHSRVVTRSILLRDPLLGVTVFTEWVTTLAHRSSRTSEAGVQTETPSTELPVSTLAVWVCYKDQRVQFDASSFLGGSFLEGYANVGSAIDGSGVAVEVSGAADLERTEPAGGFDVLSHQAQGAFLYTGESALVQVIGHSNTRISAEQAQCPETGGMLLKVAGKRFLIDSMAGIREAQSVLDWPEGLETRAFCTF